MLLFFYVLNLFVYIIKFKVGIDNLKIFILFIGIDVVLLLFSLVGEIFWSIGFGLVIVFWVY